MDPKTLTQINVLVVIILVAIIITLIIALIALSKAKEALDNSENHRKETINDIRRYIGFDGRPQIRNIVREELDKQQNKAVAQSSKEQKSTPVDPPAKPEKTEPVKPVEEQPKEPQDGPKVIDLPKPVTLFTGSYSTGAFRHITSAPDEKTVFTIYVDNADAVEGVLSIDESAYAKVAQTPDYLKNACSYSGTGTQLRVIQTGKVVKENGAWRVTEPIIAELN